MTSHGFVGGKKLSDHTQIAGEITKRAKLEGVKGVEVFFLKVPLKLPGAADQGIDVLVKFDCHDIGGADNLGRVQRFRNRLNDLTKIPVKIMEKWTPYAIIDEAHSFALG